MTGYKLDPNGVHWNQLSIHSRNRKLHNIINYTVHKPVCSSYNDSLRYICFTIC